MEQSHLLAEKRELVDGCGSADQLLAVWMQRFHPLALWVDDLEPARAALGDRYRVTLNDKAREVLGDGGLVSVRDIIVQAGRDAQVAVVNGNVSIDARVFLNAVRERIDDSATPEDETSKLRELLDAAHGRRSARSQGESVLSKYSMTSSTSSLQARSPT